MRDWPNGVDTTPAGEHTDLKIVILQKMNDEFNCQNDPILAFMLILAWMPKAVPRKEVRMAKIRLALLPRPKQATIFTAEATAIHLRGRVALDESGGMVILDEDWA